MIKTLLKSNLESIEQNIQSACLKSQRLRSDVQLVAVSKQQSVETMLMAYELGIRDFAENYPQELELKYHEFKSKGIHDIHWHFIGHLQSNKIKTVLTLAQTIHSLDSLSLLNKIKQTFETTKFDHSHTFLINVNIDRQTTKYGFYPEALSTVLPNPDFIQGLMCIPDPDRDSREAFKSLSKLSEQYQAPKLSMGMSADYQIAIELGSHYVRLGTVLFGERV